MSVVIMGIVWIVCDSLAVEYVWRENAALLLWIVVWAIYGQLQPDTLMGKASIILSWILFIFTLGCIGSQAMKDEE